MIQIIIRFLPILIVLLISFTCLISFYLSYIKYQHVTYLVPYISDTGNWPPESCIFGQLLNIVSILIALVIYLKYLQIKQLLELHRCDNEKSIFLNKCLLYVGYAAGFGMSLVANFQETNVFSIHVIGAFLAFGSGAIYINLQNIFYKKLASILGQKKLFKLRVLISLICLITFIIFSLFLLITLKKCEISDVTKFKSNDAGYAEHQISTKSEWICASTLIFYISLFYEDFKSFTIEPITLNIKKSNVEPLQLQHEINSI